MTVHIVSSVSAYKKHKKVTCTTCELKGCIGRCNWKAVGAPPAKAA